jgi:hypothetical protein
MKIISVKQLRQNFLSVKEGLDAGQRYMVMYRSRLLGHLIPPSEETAELLSGDTEQQKIQRKLKKLRQLSRGLDLGPGQDAREMNEAYDREIYE